MKPNQNGLALNLIEGLCVGIVTPSSMDGKVNVEIILNHMRTI